MNFVITSLLLISCVCFSCTDNKYKEMIIGRWTGTEWISEGNAAGYNAKKASFSFHEDDQYTYQYGDYQEKGKYFISNNNQLHTTPDNGITMMVKIIRLEGDTMIFDMNRGGESEQLTLIRQ